MRELLRELAPGKSHAAASTMAAHSLPALKPTAAAATGAHAAAGAMAAYVPPAPKPTVAAAAAAAAEQEEARKRDEARRGRGKSEARARGARRDGEEGPFGKDAVRGIWDADRDGEWSSMEKLLDADFM